ncbi:hypothetical protein [Mycolicibacterium porcinum]|uniref:Lipoprotein LpqN n=1 Tax=Mycolicibacterium porcinum TaxID=39693 RepID=A0AAW5T4Q7_9MYCO|nr:hypothetical protein [Mycolicibacterium porcinum]MCV7390419.1 hypothetical protein [Mycolicibacterium porcinum]ORB36022.1 hypothetical protein BST41_27080 [Mycolicibacterium porcinum]TVX89883.1 hypothetical protein FPV58_32770 [Mycolicibacterium porcinum]
MDRLIVVAVAAALLAACSSTEENKQATSAAAQRAMGTPTPAPAAAHCADVRADRWIDVPLAAGQPTMRIPQPPNWESEPEFIKPPMKLVLRNNALADGNGVPAITVATGEAIKPDQTAEEMLNDSIAGFANIGAQNIVQRPVTVCGYSARRVTYSADTVGATVVAVAVPLEGKMSVVIVAAQSVTPQNRTFRLDSERVLSGIRIGS